MGPLGRWGSPVLSVALSTECTEAESKEKHGVGPFAGVEYSLTLFPLQSRLRHIYHGQPYARVDFIPTV